MRELQLSEILVNTRWIDFRLYQPGWQFRPTKKLKESGALVFLFQPSFFTLINLYEKTLLGALSDTPKLADNITLLLTF